MGIVDTVRTIKQAHQSDVVLIKVGKFYHAYGKDAYIISFLFNYQLKKVDANTNTTGFPEVAIDKVSKTLNEKNINYLIINKEESEIKDFKQENKYAEIYSKAHKYQNRKNKADEIYEFLMSNIDEDGIKEKINKIEEILYDY